MILLILIEYFLKQKLLTTTLGNLKTENEELRTHVSSQDKEIRVFKIQIANLESFLPSKLTSNNAKISENTASKIEGSSSRALGRPPSSCQEWWISSAVKLADGIYLIKSSKPRRSRLFSVCFKMAILVSFLNHY